MERTTAEVLILTTTALGAGILLLIGGVIQKIMNEMDPPTFRWFLNRLNRTAMSNPFAVTVATLPFLALIAYFVAYGFHHVWFTAGLVVWFLGSIITKVTNMPVYEWVGDPKNTDVEELGRQRSKLELGNTWRARITFASVLLMACQFGVREVGGVLALSILITFPLLQWARKYTPN